MNKYMKILGLVVITAALLWAGQPTHLTQLRISASPSSITNTLTDGQIEVEGTLFALSSVDITGGLTTTTANTFVGDMSLDGDLDFLGAQEISTTTGALTLNPAENFDVVIATTDTLTAGPITVLSNYVLEGYSTGRSVIRVIDLLITDASTGGLLQLETTDVYNGDVNAAEDELTIDVAGTNFTYGDGAGADDNKVTILNAGISGVPVAVLSSEIVSNASGAQNSVNAVVVGTGIEVVFLAITTAATTADLDLLVDTGSMTVRIVYVTTL